ncbi:hypothetical protein AVEN_102434-1 [Araneus ventricosus]|uniref:Uncharacterized protein n=1 Tax=Araneus ventricosus TaxID=182803 RepID=A0A4Y2DA56_ARAVE|nr:hypothetical protein AVEN_245238-1 [Araneus ventricosus]GBL62338.1 hypothetical protein AVEN_21863-1 [Araneus ventricosus]GBL67799.1 hypothetical protein AVEN_248190-1 [Araneus ventricosus]GBM12966.1 hypothetical protein AVEN_102434-1 [Araneus ventricosus]
MANESRIKQLETEITCVNVFHQKAIGLVKRSSWVARLQKIVYSRGKQASSASCARILLLRNRYYQTVCCWETHSFSSAVSNTFSTEGIVMSVVR